MHLPRIIVQIYKKDEALSQYAINFAEARFALAKQYFLGKNHYFWRVKRTADE